MSITMNFSIYLIYLFLFRLNIIIQAQLVQLRRPESLDHFRTPTQKQLNSNIKKAPSKVIAKPGNVIVYFDSNHEIQQLNYVLQDGNLATLYQRDVNRSSMNKLPSQTSSSSYKERRNEHSIGNESNKTSTKVTNGLRFEPEWDHDNTITILNNKLQDVSQLTGDHVTVDLSKPNSDDKIGILATIARDALENGIQAGETKLRRFGSSALDKLRLKVRQKLQQLPSLIENKLRPKSSVGQLFLDQVGGNPTKSNYEDSNNLASSNYDVNKEAFKSADFAGFSWPSSSLPPLVRKTPTIENNQQMQQLQEKSSASIEAQTLQNPQVLVN